MHRHPLSSNPRHCRARCVWHRSLPLILAVVLGTLSRQSEPAVFAYENDEQSEESAAVQTYQQYLKVLFRNPRFGTAFDRVYEFHATRGTIAAFHDALDDVAGLAGLKSAESTSNDIAIPPFVTKPDPGIAALLVGMIDLQHIRGADAVTALEHATQLRPDDAVTHWYLGRARILIRQLEPAIESFERAIACHPVKTDLLELYKEFARALQRSQQDVKALEVWQRLEDLFPGDLRVKEQIALAMAQDGRWQDALKRWEAIAAETKAPEQRVQANLTASDLMIQLGQPDRAIAMLESQLASLDSDSWLFKDIRRRMESTFRNRDDLAGLVAYYEAWNREHPGDMDAMARLARTLSLQNRTEEASDWYRRAISLAPTTVSLRESLIEQLVRENRLTDAIAQYEQMAEFDAGNVDHIEDWGQLYLSQKDLPLAERQANASAVWERLLIDRQNDPVTLARLAVLMRRAELQDRAMELYRAAIEKAPAQPQYREYLGEYLYQLQRTDEAIATWKQIANGERRSKANLIRLAEVLNRFGQTTPALESMREACGMDPESFERIQFAEMLRNAAESSRTRESSDQTANNASDRSLTTSATEGRLLTEALEQLNLAEQSAETPDERQQILRERVKTLIVAGQLEEQTRLLAEELNLQKPGFSEKLGVSLADRWRTLAVYQDAGDQLNDAIGSSLKVVELEPDSIPGWTILADLYERTGQLGDAAEAMRKLASRDRRGFSEYLRKIARFEIRLGQFEAALATGRDVIKATPGNPDAYQFFADLAFEVGQPKAAVDALRQAVRVNPGDEASLRALAKTLADEFQTPEAIDLYWRAFEKAQDLDSQSNIVVALSNLYLRSDQFPKLIERLELRGRELNLRTEMTRCLATAYREAGDFRKSRETLEQLLTDDPQNVSLLKELLVLAEQEHNSPEVEQYQRQILNVTGSTEDQRRLARLLEDSGRNDEAAQLLAQVAETQTGRKQMLNEIELQTAAGYYEIAENLCRRLLKNSPGDWEAMHAWRKILRGRGEFEEERAVCRRILALEIDFESTAFRPNLSKDATPEPPLDTPASMAAWLEKSGREPLATFGQVYCDCAISLIVRASHSVTEEDFGHVFASHLVERDKLRLGACLIRAAGRRTSSARFWEAVDGLLSSSKSPAAMTIQLYALGQRREWNPLTDEEKKILSERSADLFKSLLQTAPEWLNQDNIPIMSTILLPKDQSELCLVIERSIVKRTDVAELQALWYVATNMRNPDLIKLLIPQLEMRFAKDSSLAAGIDSGTTSFDLNQAYHLFRDDPEGLLELLNFAWSSRKLNVGSPRKSNSIEFARVQQILWDRFGTESTNGVLVSLERLISLNVNELVQNWFRRQAETATLVEQSNLHLFRAALADERGDGTSELYSLIQAAELDSSNDPLRFLIARKAARLGLNSDAVQLLDSMNLTDSAFQIARETFVLDQLLKDGNSARCRVAAERLFGLPLSVDEQRALIPALEKLQMDDKVAAIQARMGRGSETRQSMLGRQLQTYVAQGKNDLAGEVAWELLKLASGGSLFSGLRIGDDRDDGGERFQALKALGRLGRLQPFIDRYEAMLAASPDSIDLLEILCDFHDAAEQWDKLLAKRDRIALLSNKAPPSLKAKAIALENSGDVSGACDIYLQMLKDDPFTFSDEMETYVQAFERAKRHADLLSAIYSEDSKRKHWGGRGQLLVNVVASLHALGTDPGVVARSAEHLLQDSDTRLEAVGAFLARPGISSETQILPFLITELSDSSDRDLSVSGRLLLLEQLRDSDVIDEVRQFVAESEQAGTPVLAGRILGLYLAAKRDDREAVTAFVTRLVEHHGVETREATQISDLCTALERLSPMWTDVRLKLLEATGTFEIEDVTVRDAILDQLGAIYELTGRAADARRLMHHRVRQLLGDREGSGVSIRQLLQAAERLQHSGFPIEASLLLLNATSHDIDEFTSDLDDDRAVAFKSRFNASLRWARQQISAERLVEWFAIAVGLRAEERSESDLDLLLELSGTTDLQARDSKLLQNVRVESVILAAIEKAAFEDAGLQQSLAKGIQRLLADDDAPASLLTAAFAFALRIHDAKLQAAILDKLAIQLATVAAESPENHSELTTMRIPETLRDVPDLAVLLTHRLGPPGSVSPNTVHELVRHERTQVESIGNRLVRIALLNECVAAAAKAGLNELAATVEIERNNAIADQIAAVSLGAPGTVDLGHEIRTRLLKLKE